MKGQLGILNVGAGDTKLSFDKSKPEEVKRSASIVTDMIQRGFAILVQVGEKDGEPLYQRAKAFDPDTCEYIIVGVPEDHHEEASSQAPAAEAPTKSRLKRKPKTYRVPASGTHAVAVARSAGG